MFSVPSVDFARLECLVRALAARGEMRFEGELGSVLIVLRSWRWDDERSGCRQEVLWTPTAALPVSASRSPARPPSHVVPGSRRAEEPLNEERPRGKSSRRANWPRLPSGSLPGKDGCRRYFNSSMVNFTVTGLVNMTGSSIVPLKLSRNPNPSALMFCGSSRLFEALSTASWHRSWKTTFRNTLWAQRALPRGRRVPKSWWKS